MMEAIYVVFEPQKDRLNADDMKRLITFMHNHQEKNRENNCQDLLNCIIIVKGGATALGRKVSIEPGSCVDFEFDKCRLWMCMHHMCLSYSFKRSCLWTSLITCLCRSTLSSQTRKRMSCSKDTDAKKTNCRRYSVRTRSRSTSECAEAKSWRSLGHRRRLADMSHTDLQFDF